MDQARSLRCHALVVAAVAAAAVAIAGIWLTTSERDVAATSSIAPADFVARLAPGERLCTAGLWMPAGSNGVRLRLSAMRPAGDRLALRLGTPEGPRTARARAARVSGDVDFPVRPIARDARVRLCLTSASGVRVAGMRDRKVEGVGYDWRRFQAYGPSPVKLDGDPVPGRLSVWFLEPETHSLASALPDVIRRATTFRPGFVGDWAYPLMLFVLLTLWAVGLGVLLRERP